MQAARRPREGFLVPDWPAPAGVCAAVTTRWMDGHSQAPFGPMNLGSRCGDDADAVAANRAALVAAFGLPAAPCWLRQVHGIEVFDADAATAAGEPVADAAVSRGGACVLAVLTADCLPLLFCDEDGAIAVAHAGWRGLAAGVIEATLLQLGAPSRILAWIGPAIGAASYEVGAEVRAAFVDADAGAAAAFATTRPGHWRCDLEALARRRLAAAGVARVSGGGFDTFTDPRFHSHRRDAPSGRFASLVWRQGTA